MANTLVMRATSLAASAALLGAGLLAALSATYVVQQIMERDQPIETSIYERPPEPPPPSDPIRQPIRQSTPIDNTIATQTPTLIDSEALPQPTEFSFDSGPVVIENPRWLQVPRDLARYYPSRAISRGMEGMVTLDCRVATDGRLSCRVVSETPANWGFGDAALRIAADYRMAPATRDGIPVEGQYRMRVPFQIH